jgi:hypothetical protein
MTYRLVTVDVYGCFAATPTPILFKPDRPSGTFCYAPSSIQVEECVYDFYCGNPGEGVITDWIILNCRNKEMANREFVALMPTAGEWDSRHVCDPSVVQGSFELDDEPYEYAMFYTGTQDPEGKGFGNSIGVAFAKKLVGPWIKRRSPLILKAPESEWGVGQPSATAIVNGQVLLTYTRSNRNRMCALQIDLANANTPEVIKEEWILSTGGLADDEMINGDIAFDSKNDIFYMVHESKPDDALPPEWITNKVFVRSIKGMSPFSCYQIYLFCHQI